jgi:hypothetical protein
MRRAYARSDAENQQAEEEGIALRDRIRALYPFHPALIDLMRERWAAIPDFQRTRGALRFLASCLRSAKREERSRALFGRGDVQLRDPEVRQAFARQLTDLFFHHGLHQRQPSFSEQVVDSLLQQHHDLGQWQDHLDIRILFGGDPAEVLHGSLLFDLVLFLQAALSFFLGGKNSPSAHYGRGLRICFRSKATQDRSMRSVFVTVLPRSIGNVKPVHGPLLRSRLVSFHLQTTRWPSARLAHKWSDSDQNRSPSHFPLIRTCL